MFDLMDLIKLNPINIVRVGRCLDGTCYLISGKCHIALDKLGLSSISEQVNHEQPNTDVECITSH